ncbi:MAG: hypothetical protein ACRDLV_16880 [Solirubrobacteraceae bacterium]
MGSTTNSTQTHGLTAEQQAYVDGLRELAGVLETNPWLISTVTLAAFVGFGYHEDGDDVAALMASTARAARGRWDKSVDNQGNFRLTRQCGPHSIVMYAVRERVCKRVVTGSETVTREVPDPDRCRPNHHCHRGGRTGRVGLPAAAGRRRVRERVMTALRAERCADCHGRDPRCFACDGTGLVAAVPTAGQLADSGVRASRERGRSALRRRGPFWCAACGYRPHRDAHCCPRCGEDAIVSGAAEARAYHDARARHEGGVL